MPSHSSTHTSRPVLEEFAAWPSIARPRALQFSLLIFQHLSRSLSHALPPALSLPRFARAVSHELATWHSLSCALGCLCLTRLRAAGTARSCDHRQTKSDSAVERTFAVVCLRMPCFISSTCHSPCDAEPGRDRALCWTILHEGHTPILMVIIPPRAVSSSSLPAATRAAALRGYKIFGHIFWSLEELWWVEAARLATGTDAKHAKSKTLRVLEPPQQ